MMNIIDFHCHPTEEGYLSFGERRMPADVSLLLRQMDAAGIQSCVVAPVTRVVEHIFEPREIGTTRFAVGLAKQYADRFLPFAGLPGTAREECESLERDIRTFGLRGVKIHPILQRIAVNDPRLDPIYEICETMAVPVLVHAGWQPGSCQLRFSRPILFDDVAARHPRLTLVLAHGGGGMGLLDNLHLEALEVASKNRNVYLGTSWTTEWVIKEALAMVGPERLLFESDFPLFDAGGALWKLRGILQNIQFVYPRLISDSDVELILGGNACRILGA